jgi:hypothetical protein
MFAAPVSLSTLCDRNEGRWVCEVPLCGLASSHITSYVTLHAGISTMKTERNKNALLQYNI